VNSIFDRKDAPERDEASDEKDEDDHGETPSQVLGRVAGDSSARDGSTVSDDGSDGSLESECRVPDNQSAN
jgi:hypothetical protein